MIETESSTSRVSGAALLVVLATAFVFAPLCRHDFTWWDDYATIHQNPLLNPPSWDALKHYWSNAENGLYIPVTYSAWLGLSTVARLNQPEPGNISLNPWVFHSANVAVHLLSAFVVYLILSQLTHRRWPSALGALVFALHPVQVEPVGWCSGFKDVLGGCFALIAVQRHLKRAQLARETDSPWVPDAVGSVCLVLAMLSKPTAIVTPLIACAIDVFILARPLSRALKSLSTWFVFAIGFAILARYVQHTDASLGVPIWVRPLILGDTIVFYLRKLFFPVWLGVDYGRRPGIVLHYTATYFLWLIPALIALVLWKLRRRNPSLICGAIVFVVGFLPVSGLAPFQFQFTSTVADHYLYLSMLGPAITVAFILRDSDSMRRSIFIGAILVMLAARSIAQTFVWQDDFSLFETAIAVNPQSALSHNNLGHAMFRAGNIDGASEMFRSAVELDPAYSAAWDNLANMLDAKGNHDGAAMARQHRLPAR